MQRFILRRMGQAIFTMFLLSLVVFLAVHVTGDPGVELVGRQATSEEIAQVRKNLGLDQPLPVQYGRFMKNISQGDFGNSWMTGRSARDMLLQRFPATLQLAGIGLVLTVGVGIPLGVLSAVKRDTFLDLFVKFFAVLGIAVPSFWIAIMLVLLFGAILGWLPTFGRGGPSHYILPAFVLGWGSMAGMLRLVRSSMLEVLDSDYVKFARVKGNSERMVIYKHALKNAVIPALTYGGLVLAWLINGSVVVEVVFAWPGIGQLALEAVQRRDHAVIEATVMAAGLAYILMALLVDILYAYANPRIRYE